MTKSIEQCIEEYESALKQLEFVEDDQKIAIYEETSGLIKYMNTLTSDMERRRTAIYEDAIKRITFSIPIVTALATIMGKTSEYNLFIIPLLGFGIAIFIVSLITIIMYWVQTQGKYIFKDNRIKEYGNSWKWFYYGNPSILRIKTIHIFKSRRAAETLEDHYSERSVNAYFDGLTFFVSNYIKETKDKSKMLQNNLQQLYLMQVHNYYKNRQHMRLSRLCKWGTIISLLVLVLLIILVFYKPSLINSIFQNK